MVGAGSSLDNRECNVIIGAELSGNGGKDVEVIRGDGRELCSLERAGEGVPSPTLADGDGR